jgi:hypothetical protein
MKIRLIIVIVLLANFAGAQDFEGTIKWSMKMDITDPQLKKQMAEAEEKMKDPATQAQMKQAMEQMNSPEMKKMMDANPQVKAQMETMMKNMQGGGSMIPSGMTLKTKGGNALSSMEGGLMAGMETLYLKDKNESYMINRQSKTYSVLPKHETSSVSSHEPTVTVTKTAETQKILNHICTKYIVAVKNGSQTVNQIFWTTTELKGVDFKSMANKNMGKSQESLYYKDLQGVPLKMEMTMPQGSMIMEVTEIKKQVLPASDFQIPAGFTITALPGQ